MADAADAVDAAARRARADDLDGILGLVGSFFEEQARLEPSFRPAEGWGELVRGFLQRSLADESYRVLVADAEGAPAGFAMGGVHVEPTFREGRLGYIADLYVASPHRGRGLGRSLVEGLMVFFRERACHNVQLNVLVANAAGVRFWRRWGFAPYMWRMKRELGALAPTAR
ncbi:MAG: GNAT family N-acetyltransferase [Planctomycetes bacterium]|nr:GNAT family N-acetyltransferase [Planctomycetota bacterium]